MDEITVEVRYTEKGNLMTDIRPLNELVVLVAKIHVEGGELLSVARFEVEPCESLS